MNCSKLLLGEKWFPKGLTVRNFGSCDRCDDQAVTFNINDITYGWDKVVYPKGWFVITKRSYTNEPTQTLKSKVIIDLRNYLLVRFNDYEIPLQMSSEEVRGLIEQFIHEYNE